MDNQNVIELDQIGTFASLPKPHAYCNPLKEQKIIETFNKTWSDSHYPMNIIVIKLICKKKETKFQIEHKIA